MLDGNNIQNPRILIVSYIQNNTSFNPLLSTVITDTMGHTHYTLTVS